MNSIDLEMLAVVITAIFQVRHSNTNQINITENGLTLAETVPERSLHATVSDDLRGSVGICSSELQGLRYCSGIEAVESSSSFRERTATLEQWRAFLFKHSHMAV
jgi:hypothetical protein